MKKYITTILVGGALALSACSPTDEDANFNSEVSAPYADERTIGTEEVAEQPAPRRTERVFREQQRK